MEPRISIITLGVTDFVRSLRFYRDGLGWPTRATEESDIAFFNTAGDPIRHLSAPQARRGHFGDIAPDALGL